MGGLIQQNEAVVQQPDPNNPQKDYLTCASAPKPDCNTFL